MKWPWLNEDFVDDTTDISFILPEYYPKWNVDVDPMYKADVIHQTSLDIKNEYLTGKNENKDMSRCPLFKFLTLGSLSLQNTMGSKNEYLTGEKKENKDMNYKIKYVKNDMVKNMLDSWTSERRTKTLTPKMIKHNGPATIVFWADGTKTVVKANPDLIEEKRICYLGESGKRHYKTVTIDRTDDSAAVMYAFVKKWICDNNDKKFHHFLKVVESREEK